MKGVVIVGSGAIARFHAQAVQASERLELEGGAPYPIPGEEARKSVELIERIYKSAGIR